MAKRKFDLKEKRKVALCLSGGGVKAAAFHVGVCMALQQKGFKVSTSVGTRNSEDPQQVKMHVGSSAGALVGAILASGYSIESLMDAFQMGQKISVGPRLLGASEKRLKPLRYWHMFFPNATSFVGAVPSLIQKRRVVTGGFEALIKSLFKINGFFTTNGIEAYLRKHVLLTNDFRNLDSDLYIVATQLNHSRKIIFGPYEKTEKKADIGYANYASISQSVAASASLPPAYAPYGIPNERGKIVYFFDGEIRDTLSTHVAVDNGADLVISSYSIQPYHYNKTMGSLHEHGIPLILNQALYQVIEQKIRRHRENQVMIGDILKLVESYFKQHDLPAEHKDRLIEQLLKRTNFNPDVDFIDIHPHAQDYEMFFFDHFSLNPAILSRIVKIGFKSAIRALRTYDI
jgi:predicted acylesterase/phospholipase RssA